MLGHILGGLIVVVCGGCLMYFSNALADMFGPSLWTQKYFGGTRNATLSIGFVVMVIGFLMMFGIFAPSTSDIGSLQYQ